MELGPTAGAFALALASVELAKFAVVKISSRNGNGKKSVCGLSPIQAQQLHDLHAWHDERDEDGRLLWFTPRTMMKEQTKLLVEIRDELRRLNR